MTAGAADSGNMDGCQGGNDFNATALMSPDCANSLVKWLEWLTAKQEIWVQFLVKSLIFFVKPFCWIRLIRWELSKKLELVELDKYFTNSEVYFLWVVIF